MLNQVGTQMKLNHHQELVILSKPYHAAKMVVQPQMKFASYAGQINMYLAGMVHGLPR